MVVKDYMNIYRSLLTATLGLVACASPKGDWDDIGRHDFSPAAAESVEDVHHYQGNGAASRPDYLASEEESAILEYADENQVLMFGENHREQRDDECMKYLLPGLKECGFDYLAVEIPFMYSNIMEDYVEGRITEDSYDRRIMAFAANSSSSDSHSDILRVANDAGMRIVFYDAWASDPYSNERDWRQFMGIRRQIFDKDPGAKVVVWGGFRHFNKEPVPQDDGERIRLGYHLSEYVDGDAVSIIFSRSCYGAEFDYDMRIDVDKPGPEEK